MHIETFITAPHGMIKYIDNHGSRICKSDGKSQKYFISKKKLIVAWLILLEII